MAVYLDARKNVFRFIILSFNWLVFGGYFCMDMPSALQTHFQQNYTCVSNESCCKDCLGMSGPEYNLLYSVYAWTNAVIIVATGFLLDKLGNQVGAFLFSFSTITGAALFAGGAMKRKSDFMLPMMIIGRILQGAGNGSLLVLQNRITSYWFKDKELAFGFGITLALNRLGSVLNFLITERIEESIGLIYTLWFGTILCVLNFILACICTSLDKFGKKQLNQDIIEMSESKSVKITHIRYFSLQFWLLSLTIMFFYNGLFPFISDASTFIQDKFGYGKRDASYITGIVYDISLILSPLLGGIIDVCGKRGYLALACAVFTIPVFALLAFTDITPILSTTWLGITYSLATASMLASLPMVTVQATLGTALGVAGCIQMLGTGISNTIIGAILGQNETLPTDEKLVRWKYVMIYLLANQIGCVITSSFLNVVDNHRGGVLNLSRKQKIQSLINNDNHIIPNDEMNTENDHLLPKPSRSYDSFINH